MLLEKINIIAVKRISNGKILSTPYIVTSIHGGSNSVLATRLDMLVGGTQNLFFDGSTSLYPAFICRLWLI